MTIIWQPTLFEDVQRNVVQKVLIDSHVKSIDVPNWGFRDIIDLRIKGIKPQSLHPFGSMEFVLYGLNHNWNIQFNDQFNYINSAEKYGNLFLNSDLRVSRLQDVSIDAPTYIRPTEAFNRIAGIVYGSQSEWNHSVEHILPTLRTYIPYSYNNSLVITAKPKEILKEYRVFIVNGESVSSSSYIIDGILNCICADTYDELKHFVSRVLDQWMPCPTFVLDIAQTSRGFFVLETNCVHCSDLYECNTNKVMNAYIKLFMVN